MGYKIIKTRCEHLCYECGDVISLGCLAVIDLIFHHGYPRGHPRITQEKAHFHPQCYRDKQLMAGEYKEFDNLLKGANQ